MATSFAGYLLKINDHIFPHGKFIRLNSYKVTPNQIQDEDSYQDATGELHRNILPHTRSKIEFNTKSMWLPEKMEFQSYLPSRKEITVEYWDDESNGYNTGRFYVPDITYEINRMTEENICYNPVRIALIEY